MTRQLVKDRQAEEDLIGVWTYTFETWGEARADSYFATLEAGIQRVLESPMLGRDRGELRLGYRSVRVEHHVVFYTFTDTEVRVRRVLHEAMDPDRHV
ncbi:MAG: type II toxin-antitoxin system RelE/ParE family toxin [Candidatus Eisenbacteria bacterium]